MPVPLNFDLSAENFTTECGDSTQATLPIPEPRGRGGGSRQTVEPGVLGGSTSAERSLKLTPPPLSALQRKREDQLQDWKRHARPWSL